MGVVACFVGGFWWAHVAEGAFQRRVLSAPGINVMPLFSWGRNPLWAVVRHVGKEAMNRIRFAQPSVEEIVHADTPLAPRARRRGTSARTHAKRYGAAQVVQLALYILAGLDAALLILVLAGCMAMAGSATFSGDHAWFISALPAIGCLATSLALAFLATLKVAIAQLLRLAMDIEGNTRSSRW